MHTLKPIDWWQVLEAWLQFLCFAYELLAWSLALQEIQQGS